MSAKNVRKESKKEKKLQYNEKNTFGSTKKINKNPPKSSKKAQ